MTGEEKAAALLLALPKEAGETVLALLGSARSARLRAEMQRLEKLPRVQDAVEQALRELEELLSRQPASVAGPAISPSAQPPPAPAPESRPPAMPPAEKEPEKRAPAEPEKKAARARKSSPDGPSDEDIEQDPVGALASLPVERLALALQGEHSRIAALVLHHLDPQQAGDMLKQLPQEVRAEVTIFLSRAPTAGIEMVQRIARALLHKDRGRHQAVQQESGDARFKKIADMLRMLEEQERADVLQRLAEYDGAIAAAVRDHLHEFNDLLLFEDRTLQKLLAQVDMKTLAVALKSAPEALIEKVFKNLSRRAGETLTEEMEYLGSVPAAQVQQARRVVVEAIQRLEQAGELLLTG